ncbi:MAG: glycosyltransferase family 2 protein, partial [Bacteroidota bacterium]
MIFIKVIFWILAGLILYVYIGYGILLIIITRLKRIFSKKCIISDVPYEPEVTLFVTAYNEKDYIDQKIRNSFELNYPKEKIKFIWVTDGSDDGTPEILAKYSDIELYHLPERSGKVAAMNRGMLHVKTPIVIFSDGNTLLAKETVREIANAFMDPLVGCVSGEKRIIDKRTNTASGSGEGLYWKYESKLKQLDSELYSVVGAAGELFAIRTNLFKALENDTILDDFIMSMRIAMKGYRIKYAPDAFAYEMPSSSVKEELKRKIRIAAGGFQSVGRLVSLLNIFKYRWLSFQYISHKFLRWLVVPFALLFIIPLNILLISDNYCISCYSVYILIFYCQLAFYLLVFLGWCLQNIKIKLK